jgi:ABC-type cobalt transport system substrate-binding protein
MRKRNILLAAGLAMLLSLAGYVGVRHPGGGWKGVDETVVEKFAAEAGRPAREPYLNTDRGDLLLLVFLLGGAAGGFLLGYWFRELFGLRPEGGDDAQDA